VPQSGLWSPADAPLPMHHLDVSASLNQGPLWSSGLASIAAQNRPPCSAYSCVSHDTAPPILPSTSRAMFNREPVVVGAESRRRRLRASGLVLRIKRALLLEASLAVRHQPELRQRAQPLPTASRNQWSRSSGSTCLHAITGHSSQGGGCWVARFARYWATSSPAQRLRNPSHSSGGSQVLAKTRTRCRTRGPASP
jgi:hypothetical protein